MDTPKIHNRSNDPQIETRLQELLALMFSFYGKEIDMRLERIERFLEKLGSPHLNLPRVVHVAGTNGKGSTISILKSLLEESGASVHVMTSPHLVHVTERITIAGNLITSAELVSLLEECLAANDNESITYFEIMTAATYLAFSRAPADYVLLETGMGGRLDATNVVPNPACTVITTISKDHQAFLGDTLPEIAAEKAGIMKSGAPCVIGYQTEEAIQAGVLEVFDTQSRQLSTASPLYQHGAEWSVAPKEGQVHFRFQEENYVFPPLSLKGYHQIYNMGAALAAYRVITDAPLDAEKLSPALGKVHWPARLQSLDSGKLRDILPDDWDLIIDGGHNDSAGSFLAQQMDLWQKTDSKPLHLIVAMVNRKEPSAFLKPLIPYVESITVTEIEGEISTFKIDELYKHVQSMDFKTLYKADNIEQALENLTCNYTETPAARVFMTGSLYFMGNILSR